MTIQCGGIFCIILRQNGITEQQMKFVNTKILRSGNELPQNLAYATYTNKDKCAINEGIFSEGIFSEILKQTHSKHIDDALPDR